MELAFIESGRRFPEWMYLDFIFGNENRPPHILLGVAKPVVDAVFPLNESSQEIVRQREELVNLGHLDVLLGTEIDKPWGFGGCIIPKVGDSPPGFKEFTFEIPLVEYEKAESCDSCGGTGKREEDEDMECLRCDGVGKETQMDWGSVDRLAATLSILGALEHPKVEWLQEIKQVESARSQLFSFDFFHGAEARLFSCAFSGSFARHLRGRLFAELPHVKAATMQAYQTMFPRSKKFGDMSYGAKLHSPGQLIIEVPGDGSLFLPGEDVASQGAMRLVSTLSSPAHQLALLAGLAVFLGATRRNNPQL